MAYAPGTKLSFNNGDECCTVLTEGNALVTKVWGSRLWEMMKLADWLILAEGKETVSNPVSNPVSKPVEPVEPAYPKRSVGTKLHWTHEKNARTAIVTSKGILQVKYRCNDGTFYTKVFFDSEEAWRASLPKYGVVSVTPYLKLWERTFETSIRYPLPAGLSDPQKLIQLQHRFNAGRQMYGDTNTISVLPKYGKELKVTVIDYSGTYLITTDDGNIYKSFNGMNRSIGISYDGFGKPIVLLNANGNSYFLNHFF
jgi:hypothetical protein